MERQSRSAREENAAAMLTEEGARSSPPVKYVCKSPLMASLQPNSFGAA
jgi:hypothetical protein